jgi:hypothetical protein
MHALNSMTSDIQVDIKLTLHSLNTSPTIAAGDAMANAQPSSQHPDVLMTRRHLLWKASHQS